LKKDFNKYQENNIFLPPLFDLQIYEKVKDVNVVFGKMKKKQTVTKIWKKRSISFYFPYWGKLDVRYCIDVMHIKK